MPKAIFWDHRPFPTDGPRSTRYENMHQWINKRFPRVGRCEYCGTTKRKTEYCSTRGHVLTYNRADWLELCRRCHRSFDGHGARIRARRTGTGRYLPGAWLTPSGRWRAYGRRDGRAVHLGMYDTEEEAAHVAADFLRTHFSQGDSALNADPGYT